MRRSGSGSEPRRGGNFSGRSKVMELSIACDYVIVLLLYAFVTNNLIVKCQIRLWYLATNNNIGASEDTTVGATRLAKLFRLSFPNGTWLLAFINAFVGRKIALWDGIIRCSLTCWIFLNKLKNVRENRQRMKFIQFLCQGNVVIVSIIK